MPREIRLTKELRQFYKRGVISLKIHRTLNAKLDALILWHILYLYLIALAIWLESS